MTITANLVPTDPDKPTVNKTVQDLTTVASSIGSLQLTKSVSPTGNQPPGTTIVYTIAFKNAGLGALYNVILYDYIPSYTTFVTQFSATAGKGIEYTDPSGTVTELTNTSDADGGEVSGNNIKVTVGTVSAGQNGKIRFKVTID